jgi:hypothetical protein
MSHCTQVYGKGLIGPLGDLSMLDDTRKKLTLDQGLCDRKQDRYLRLPYTVTQVVA